MRVCDLVRFSEDKYFNGAVQTDWFYDSARIGQIASSYVFHGPKYFGVSQKDISKTKHQLIDSASFAKTLADKLYAPSGENTNNFIMTIAGYGAGKSHLAVCLGALFSGEASLVKLVTDNIRQADESIGSYIESINTKKNLVIVLNGMHNFNLDAEILKCARMALRTNGIDDDVLRSITKSYDIARHFVEKNFALYSSEFEKSAKAHSINTTGNKLKEYLINNIEASNVVIETINAVYTVVNGDSIHWDRGISAGDILTLLSEKLCGKNHPFNRVLLLFDEFGRYIEYAASNPAIAGEAALQQVFESIQSANGNIVFTGFIQNDLSAYLSRIEKTANIIRYVGRYENSEKLYLSSNFETILANLLSKNENNGFSRVLNNATNRYEKFHNRIFEALLRWDRTAQKKAVWMLPELYKSVILKGCYPLHPITTWLLSNTSSWMQQRSTIAFAAEMYSAVAESEVDGTWLPYVYPIDIVDSNIYNEMLNSEEKGLVQSQFCMLYRDITLKVGNKLSEEEAKVLKAILVINIGRFSLRDKDDALQAIRLCSNLKEDEIEPALKSLEDMHGVIAYDENARTYDLIAEASGFNEFKRIYAKYRIRTVATIDDIDSDLMREALLSGTVETSFAQDHSISSNEWVFEKRLLAASDIDRPYLETLKKSLDSNYTGEAPRGFLVYAYCNADRDAVIERIAKDYKVTGVSNYPIIILFLDDPENEVIDALTIKKTISKFSSADQERFQKHIAGQIRASNRKIIQKCVKLISQKQQITSAGITTYEGRLNGLCSARFNEIYTSAPPFTFDGFQNKTTAQAKKYLSNICIKLFDRTLMNIQSYQALTQDEKNRVRSCLSTNVVTSWQVFDSNCQLRNPANPLINRICETIGTTLKSESATNLFAVTEQFMRPPYGMNINAIALLIFYYIAYHGNKLLCYYGQEKLIASHLSDKVFKGSKLQVAELKKIRLQINENAEVDQVAEICKKALSVSMVEDCAAIARRLDELTTQEGVSAENQALVAQAKIRLDEGKRIKRIIEERNGKAREIIQSAKKKFVIHRFVKVFDYITDFSAPLSDEYSFSCGEALQTQVGAIYADAKNMLATKYPSAISTLTCDITQLSQVKLLYGKVAETLEKNGYEDFAKTTVSRLRALEDELVAKQKYEAILAEIERDIAIYSDATSFSFRKVDDALDKMNKWLSYLGNVNDIPKSVVDPLKKKINNTIGKLDNRRNELLRMLESGFDCIAKAGCLNDLTDAEKNMQRLKLLELDPTMEERVENAISDLNQRIHIVKTLPDNIDDLCTAESVYPAERDKAVYHEVISRLQILRNNEEKWLRNNVFEPMDIAKFSAAQCADWIESSSVLPAFLSSEARHKHEAIRDLVDMQLHKCRVEGVLSMFDKLNDDEQEQCLQILLERKK